MNDYTPLNSNELKKSHLNYLNKLSASLESITNNSNLILGITSIDGTNIMTTNRYAKCVGYTNTMDIIGKYEHEFPCVTVAKFHHEYKKQRKFILNHKNLISLQTINILNYQDGIKARLFSMSPIIHEKSKSILGFTHHGHDISFTKSLNALIETQMIPSCHGITYRPIELNLTVEELELCFLVLLKLTSHKIVDYLNYIRKNKTCITANCVTEKIIALCNKLNLPGSTTKHLYEFLELQGLKYHIPISLFKAFEGTHIIEINKLCA